MNDTTRLLDQLRDLREPLPPEGTSLWLLGANLLAFVAVVSLLWYLRRRRHHGWRRQLLADLRKTRLQTPEQTVLSAATIIRQLVLFRGQPVETLHGDPWLQQLDAHFNTQWFTQGNGRVFGESLYQQPANLNQALTGTIISELEQLIKQLPANPSPTSKGP